MSVCLSVWDKRDNVQDTLSSREGECVCFQDRKVGQTTLSVFEPNEEAEKPLCT